jgi:glycosyltransferase involved in cell wall biosynthesis
VLNQLCDDNCISILPWSNAAVESIKNYFKEDFNHFSKKIKVLYPALPNYYYKYGNTKDHSIIKDSSSEIKILFIGKDYRRKGLLELLDAFKQLQYKYNNLHLYCISDLPNEVINRYKNYKIDFYPCNFKQEELVKKFFLNVDLFILPTHVDTFGMVLLESLSSGVPVITTKQFAAEEIIQEGINGWFVDSKKLPLNNFSYLNIGDDYLEQFPENILINSIVQVVSDIIDNNKFKDVRKENCYNEFDSNGKFSINKRNYILNSLFHGNN